MKNAFVFAICLLLAACSGSFGQDEPASPTVEPVPPTAEVEEAAIEEEEAEEPPTEEPPTEEPPTEEPPTEEPEAPEEVDIIQLLTDLGGFDILLAALEESGAITLLEEEGITLFAPEDTAFDNLAPETIDQLFQEPDLFARILTYHVAAEPLSLDELWERRTVEMIPGETVTVVNTDIQPKVNNANLIGPDLQARNGLVHVIDQVLMSVAPPPPEAPDLLTGIETWAPFPTGEFLPIGDAQLVPGAEPMRFAVETLGGLLLDNQVQINTARTVRLEEEGEITYVAPVSPPTDPGNLQEILELQSLAPYPQGEESQVLGVLLLDGELQGDYGPGPYLIYADGLSSEAPLIVLIDESGESVIEFEGVLTEDEGMSIEEFPSVAIFFGTRYCKSWGTNWFTERPYHVCYPCFFGDFNTLGACQGG